MTPSSTHIECQWSKTAEQTETESRNSLTPRPLAGCVTSGKHCAALCFSFQGVRRAHNACSSPYTRGEKQWDRTAETPYTRSLASRRRGSRKDCPSSRMASLRPTLVLARHDFLGLTLLHTHYTGTVNLTSSADFGCQTTERRERSPHSSQPNERPIRFSPDNRYGDEYR